MTFEIPSQEQTSDGEVRLTPLEIAQRAVSELVIQANVDPAAFSSTEHGTITSLQVAVGEIAIETNAALAGNNTAKTE